jgi:hypothetical protein
MKPAEDFGGGVFTRESLEVAIGAGHAGDGARRRRERMEAPIDRGEHTDRGRLTGGLH